MGLEIVWQWTSGVLATMVGGVITALIVGSPKTRVRIFRTLTGPVICIGLLCSIASIFMFPFLSGEPDRIEIALFAYNLALLAMLGSYFLSLGVMKMHSKDMHKDQHPDNNTATDLNRNL